MDEKKLKSISFFATLALFLLLILFFGFVWGEFKTASGIGVEKNVSIDGGAVMNDAIYVTGETAVGKSLFQANCARCHLIDKRMTGPALMGVKQRWSDSTALYTWIRNSQEFLSTGDPYANEMFREYKSIMPAFPQLSDADIKEILFYVDPGSF